MKQQKWASYIVHGKRYHKGHHKCQSYVHFVSNMFFCDKFLMLTTTYVTGFADINTICG